MNKLLNLVIVLALLIGGAASVFAYQENSENGRLSGVAEQLQEEASQLRRKIEEAAGKRMELEAEKKELQTKLDSSANWLIARRYQLSLAGDRITDLEAQLGSRVWQVELLEFELGQLRLSLEEEKREVTSLKFAISPLQKQNAGLKEELGIRQGQIADLGQILRGSQQALYLQGEEVTLLSTFLVKLAAPKKGSPYRVVPVYFVPAGMTLRPNGLLNINLAVAEIQAWFSGQVGKTFEWDPAIGVRGKNPYAWYYNSSEQYGGVWARALEEVVAVLPRNAEDTLYLIFFEGWTDPVAEGLSSGDWSGGFRFAFVGKEVMEWLSVDNPLQRQSVLSLNIHEIVHALLRSSKHDLEEGSIMNPSVSSFILHKITDDYRKKLKDSPFLR